MKYFVYDPEGDGMVFFNTQEERDAYAKECIELYLADDGWDDLVTNVIAGVITHRAKQVDRIERPEFIDEDGVDEEGGWWDSDCKYKCNYKLLPVGEP